MGQRASRFHSLSDADLVDLLHTAGDELPREVVDEFLGRGPRTITLLHFLVSDKMAWTRPLPEWWAVVHATYILGAMENPSALPSLLSALRWADAFDCEWVTEDLPSMLGRLGGAVRQPLQAILNDAAAGAGARSIALYGLAAASTKAGFLLQDALERAAAILADDGEELYLRQTAANVLLDFRAQNSREALKEFGREEAARRDEDPEYQGVFYDWEVDDFLDSDAEGTDALEYYRKDWLVFYDSEEIERRRERWAREQEEAAKEAQIAGTATGARDLRGPCSCGSGKSFETCCYLKVH